MENRLVKLGFNIERRHLLHLLFGISDILQRSTVHIEKLECLHIEHVDLVEALIQNMEQLLSLLFSLFPISDIQNNSNKKRTGDILNQLKVHFDIIAGAV